VRRKEEGWLRKEEEEQEGWLDDLWEEREEILREATREGGTARGRIICVPGGGKSFICMELEGSGRFLRVGVVVWGEKLGEIGSKGMQMILRVEAA
jgi:hypothetical protein